MLMRIGLLVGDEPELCEQLMRRLQRHEAATVERIEVGPTGDNHIGRYDVILDRVSQLVPCYRSYLRTAALGGTTVVNPPTRLGAQDKLMTLGLARQLGMAVARAALLPQQAYGSYVDTSRALGNLQYPFRFDRAADYVGFPALLEALDQLPWRAVQVHDLAELMAHFDASGARALMLRQAAAADADGLELFKVLVLGERTLLLKRREDGWRSVQGGAQHDALVERGAALSRALGYCVNALDFACLGGETLLLDGHQPWCGFEAVPAGASRELLWESLAESLVRAPDVAADNA